MITEDDGLIHVFIHPLAAEFYGLKDGEQVEGGVVVHVSDAPLSWGEGSAKLTSVVVAEQADAPPCDGGH